MYFFVFFSNNVGSYDLRSDPTIYDPTYLLRSYLGSRFWQPWLHAHQWGQGVSYGYLIWRWQLLLGLLFYHALMAGLLGLESLLRSSRGLLRATWCLPLLWFWSAEDMVVLDSILWQSGFLSFLLGHFFLLGVGLGPDIKWAEVSRSLWTHTCQLGFIVKMLSI